MLAQDEALGAGRESTTISVQSYSEVDDEGRWAWVYDWWPPMLLGAGIFAAGLLVGWLIWG